MDESDHTDHYCFPCLTKHFREVLQVRHPPVEFDEGRSTSVHRFVVWGKRGDIEPERHFCLDLPSLKNILSLTLVSNFYFILPYKDSYVVGR